MHVCTYAAAAAGEKEEEMSLTPSKSQLTGTKEKSTISITLFKKKQQEVIIKAKHDPILDTEIDVFTKSERFSRRVANPSGSSRQTHFIINHCQKIRKVSRGYSCAALS